MANLADVAREVGCSIKTVSRAVNNSPEISPETRSRILSVAERLGYAPNSLARSLVTGRTGFIGLVVPNTEIPSFAMLINEVERAAGEASYTVLLSTTHWDNSREEQAINLLRQNKVEGIILRPAEARSAHLQAVRDAGIPLVLVYKDYEELEVDYVGTDCFKGAYEATSHLVALGHRRIAYLGEEATFSSMRARLSGYRQALRDAGIAVDERLICQQLANPADMAGAYRLTSEILKANPRCTALFTSTGLVAPPVMLAIRQTGRRVPDDVALLGFSDYSSAAYLEPPLTCVRTPVAEEGRRAAELLFRRISGDRTSPPQKVIVPPSLVVRGSCGAKIISGPQVPDTIIQPYV